MGSGRVKYQIVPFEFEDTNIFLVTSLHLGSGIVPFFHPDTFAHSFWFAFHNWRKSNLQMRAQKNCLSFFPSHAIVIATKRSNKKLWANALVRFFSGLLFSWSVNAHKTKGIRGLALPLFQKCALISHWKRHFFLFFL